MDSVKGGIPIGKGGPIGPREQRIWGGLRTPKIQSQFFMRKGH